MKTKIIYSLLISFFCIGVSYSQLTHITGPTLCELPPASGTAVGGAYTAYPTNLPDYEWWVVGAPSINSVVPNGRIYTTYSTLDFRFYDPGIYTINCYAGKLALIVVTVRPYNYKSISYNSAIKKIEIEPIDITERSTSILYQISDLTTGRIVDKGYIDNRVESVDVSKLSKGMYVFNMETGNNKNENYKFIIK